MRSLHANGPTEPWPNTSFSTATTRGILLRISAFSLLFASEIASHFEFAVVHYTHCHLLQISQPCSESSESQSNVFKTAKVQIAVHHVHKFTGSRIPQASTARPFCTNSKMHICDHTRHSSLPLTFPLVSLCACRQTFVTRLPSSIFLRVERRELR